MTLNILSPSETAARIDHPFAPVQLGVVGDMGILVFRAHGNVNWHRHIDEDEIFLVHDGLLKVETQLGNTVLHTGEALLIPKGVAHHSGSIEPAVVLLFRQQVLVERKNGHRRNLATGEEEPLKKMRLTEVLNDTSPPYHPKQIVKTEMHDLSIFTARGASPSQPATAGSVMLYVLYGALEVEIENERARLEQGQLTFLPRETRYTLQAEKSAIVVRFE